MLRCLIIAPSFVSTHSRAEAAALSDIVVTPSCMFQHTAARRRLRDLSKPNNRIITVSTHSRAEAAARLFYRQIKER